jgi:hypothetical protein
MERIGLRCVATADHPRIPVGHPLRPHVIYHLAAADGAAAGRPD